MSAVVCFYLLRKMWKATIRMAARSCETCEIDWPLAEVYRECPSCVTPTTMRFDVMCMNAVEAKSLRLWFEFERFYATYDITSPPLEVRCRISPSTR